MAARSHRRPRLVFGAVAVVAAAVLFALLWSDLARGLRSLRWESAPATTLMAWYHTGYDPVASHGMDGDMSKSWTGLALAYTTPAGEHFVTEAFDTTGLSGDREWFFRPLNPNYS